MLSTCWVNKGQSQGHKVVNVDVNWKCLTQGIGQGQKVVNIDIN